MKVGIIGSGTVGQTLAQGFVKLGHSVMIGSSHEAKQRELYEKYGTQMVVADMPTTANFGELLVLAVKGSAALIVVEELKSQLANKTIIDATNPIEEAPPIDGVLRYRSSINYSLMEELQERVPEAKFVKAFNSVGSDLMVDPDLDLQPTMFICGNDQEAKNEVAQITTLFGWEVRDMGSAVAARAIEPLAMLWCIPGFRENKWNHAFKLVEK